MGVGMGMGWTGKAHLSQQLCPCSQFNAGTGPMPLHHTAVWIPTERPNKIKREEQGLLWLAQGAGKERSWECSEIPAMNPTQLWALQLPAPSSTPSEMGLPDTSSGYSPAHWWNCRHERQIQLPAPHLGGKYLYNLSLLQRNFELGLTANFQYMILKQNPYVWIPQNAVRLTTPCSFNSSWSVTDQFSILSTCTVTLVQSQQEISVDPKKCCLYWQHMQLNHSKDGISWMYLFWFQSSRGTNADGNSFSSLYTYSYLYHSIYPQLGQFVGTTEPMTTEQLLSETGSSRPVLTNET